MNRINLKSLVRVFCLLVVLCSASTSAYAQEVKNTPHPTAEQKRWMGKSRIYGKIYNKLVDSLKSANASEAQNLCKESLDNVEDISIYLEDEVLPFFSDFHESTKVSQFMAVKQNGKINGFAIYSAFRSKIGKEKPYMVKIIDQDGKPKVSEIVLNRAFRDDYPQYAKEFEKSHPKVEQIRPTSQPNSMWEAPKEKKAD